MENRHAAFEQGRTYRLSYMDGKGRRNIRQFRFLKTRANGSVVIEIADDTLTISSLCVFAGHYPYEIEQIG